IGNVARFAPSACNTQPWLVESEQDPEGKQTLVVYRYKKPGKRGIMPADKVAYYNRIDIGIYLLFLEVCLKQKEIAYERMLYEDEQDDEAEKTLVARYCLNT
ncbi:MAG: nitroreductase, partial [Lachnospiraceae bacterium]|nr:nitroreductase [Lachnospiraceae bacterium]